MKIAMLLAIVLVFACPLIGYAQNPVLKPGEAALYITENGEHLSVMIVKIGLDGAQTIEQRRMIKHNDEVQPNIIVCSISSLDSVIAGLDINSAYKATSQSATNNSLTGVGTDLIASGESPVTTKPLAVEIARSKVEPQPRRAVKKTVAPKQIRASATYTAKKETPTVEKTEEPQPSTQPRAVPAQDAGTSTGTQPADPPPPPPAITVTEKFTALGIMIASLSLVLLILIVVGFLIDRREFKRLRKDLAAVYEANYQTHERSKDLALKQQLDHPPVKSNKATTAEAVSEVTLPIPTAEVTDEMLIPTITDIPSVSADTGKILSPDTANLTEPLQENPTTEQVVSESEGDGTLTIQASELYLNQCLARVYEVKPQVEGWLSDVMLALHPDATTEDVDEATNALAHERIDNSLYFAGIKQITIGHPRSCFVTGKHNEHLVLKSGMKSWHVVHKIWERSQMESPANKPEEGDLKIAVNHSYKKEE